MEKERKRKMSSQNSRESQGQLVLSAPEQKAPIQLPPPPPAEMERGGVGGLDRGCLQELPFHR